MFQPPSGQHTWQQMPRHPQGRSYLLSERPRITEWEAEYCEICTELVPQDEVLGCKAGHVWCKACFHTWMLMPERVAELIVRKSLSVPCLHGTALECGELLPSYMVEDLGACECESRERCSCPALHRAVRDLQERQRLLDTANGRKCIECPDPNCVGIAYEGSSRLMCFVCTRQWHRGPFGRLASCRNVLRLPFRPSYTFRALCCARVRPCPSCGRMIEKDGGCNHMTCHCRHEFWWRTGMRYRPR